MVDSIEQLQSQLNSQLEQLNSSKKLMEDAFKKMQSNMGNLPKEVDKKIGNGMKAILMSDGRIIIEFESSSKAADYFAKLW